MIEFDYGCYSCGERATNHTLDSFSCKCGGTFVLVNKHSFEPSLFEPHYNEVIKDYVTSWKDMEAKGKRFRSVDHPNGFVVTDPKSKFIRELKHIYKHREDYLQMQHSGDGRRYKPGSKVRFDEKNQEFIPADGSSRSRRTYFIPK